MIKHDIRRILHNIFLKSRIPGKKINNQLTKEREETKTKDYNQEKEGESIYVLQQEEQKGTREGPTGNHICFAYKHIS